jgi:hypothetical protein
MNRYPVWKYLVIAITLVIAALYTLPNFFGEAPAVQVSSLKTMTKVDNATVTRVEDALKAAGLQAEQVSLDGSSVRARFTNTDNQLKAKDAIQRALISDAADPTYIVALNLLSRSPEWLRAIHAGPMYLGLDLRGGVHFMLQVDMQAALTKRVESLAGDLRLACARKACAMAASAATAKRPSCACVTKPASMPSTTSFASNFLICKPAWSPRAASSSWWPASSPRPCAACKTRRSSKTF